MFSGQDYHTKFDNKWYLSNVWNAQNLQMGGGFVFDIVKSFHDIFEKEVTTNTDGSVLDFGCGPSIHSAISASRRFSNVICADYTEQGRSEVTKWRNMDPDSHDWSPFIEFAAKSEGCGPKEVELRVREAIKDVQSCDALADQVISVTTYAPYDVIIACLCLHVACPSHESFKAVLTKLTGQLKPGGLFVLVGLLGEDWFCIGAALEKFKCLNQNQASVEEGLSEAGLGNVSWSVHDVHPMAREMGMTNGQQYYILSARKV